MIASQENENENKKDAMHRGSSKTTNNKPQTTNNEHQSRNKKHDVLYDANVYDVRSDAVLPKIQDVN